MFLSVNQAEPKPNRKANKTEQLFKATSTGYVTANKSTY